MTNHKILGLIPARAGSKGYPRKNVKPLLGKSLIQRAYESAIESAVLDRIILSTNDPEAERIARGIGLETPFGRPDDLAGDDVSMLDVVLHSLEFLQQTGYVPEAVMILQPTSPLRTPEHIRRAVDLLENHDSVCSVVRVPNTLCPHYVMKIREDGMLDFFLKEASAITRRQDVPQAYVRDGTVYLTRTAAVVEDQTLYGGKCRPLVLKECETISIDTPEDWTCAEQRLISLVGSKAA